MKLLYIWKRTRAISGATAYDLIGPGFDKPAAPVCARAGDYWRAACPFRTGDGEHVIFVEGYGHTAKDAIHNFECKLQELQPRLEIRGKPLEFFEASERTLPAVSFDDLGDIPTLMQVAGYDYNDRIGFDERLRRLVALAAFEAIMLELGAERIASHTSARYRLFTQFGEWGASLDPEGKDVCWLFTRFDEPGRVPLPAGQMNKHSGKWNHILDVQDGKVEFLPFIYQCEALGLQSLTGDDLERERAAFEAREAETRARYAKAFA